MHQARLTDHLSIDTGPNFSVHLRKVLVTSKVAQDARADNSHVLGGVGARPVASRESGGLLKTALQPWSLHNHPQSDQFSSRL